MVRYFVVDTDCGVDDGHALILLLNFNKFVKDHFNGEEVKVVGISCVSGNTTVDNVLVNVQRVLTVTGNTNIPVSYGADKPICGLKAKVDAEYYHGLDGFGDNNQCKAITVNTDFSPEPAAIFLSNLSKQYEHNLEVVALGPLTNLATAYNIDPQFPKRLKAVHIMGGNHTGRGNITHAAEFNFFADPEAAQTVLQDFDCEVEITTWETTMMHRLTEKGLYLCSAVSSPTARLFRCMNDNILKKCDTLVNYDSVIPLPSKIIDGEHTVFPSFESLNVDANRRTDFFSCDAIAMFAVLLPSFVLSRLRLYASVETAGKFTRGQTVLGWVESHVKEPMSIRKRSIVVEIDHFAMETAFILACEGTLNVQPAVLA